MKNGQEWLNTIINFHGLQSTPILHILLLLYFVLLPWYELGTIYHTFGCFCTNGVGSTTFYHTNKHTPKLYKFHVQKYLRKFNKLKILHNTH